MKDEEEITRRLSFVASLLSIITISVSLVGSVIISVDIERHISEYAQEVEQFLNISRDASHSMDDSIVSRRVRRQFYATPYRERQYHNGRGGSVYPSQAAERWGQTSSSWGDEKHCDCSVTRCPTGPRGAPGRDGHAAIDGLPGQPGKPGTDGIFLINIECEPCPPGKKGEPGPAGSIGQRGRTGPPGGNGIDGVNEPGVTGPTGPRGQPGINGKDGINGEPGQDAILLIGKPGKKGPPGPVGFAGARGDPGKTGEPAPPGKEGLSGPQGDPGDMGDEGPRGSRGQSGQQGENGGYCECPGKKEESTAPPESAESVNRFDYEDNVVEQFSSLAQRPSQKKIPSLPQPESLVYPSRPIVYPQQQQQWSNPWRPTVPQPPLKAYVVPPQNYRNRYPMIQYRDSREQQKEKRSDSRISKSGSQVQFDLR